MRQLLPIKHRGRERGFTLVELLAVIAIIGILAGILIPTIGAVRERARTTQCASNLREIGMAMGLFAGEHRDNFPISYDDPKHGGTAWMWQLASYSGMNENAMGAHPRPRSAGIFVCPSFDPERIKAREVSYKYNRQVIHPTHWYYRRGAPPSPPRTFLVVEAANNGEYLSIAGEVVTRRHSDGETANYLFADGHVEVLKGDIPSNDPRWKWW